MCRTSETPVERIRAAVAEMPVWMARQRPGDMGAVVIEARELINGLEAISAEATRRFEKSGAYKADGALGMVAWLRDKGKMSGGEAAEHVQVARHLEQLPRTEEALVRGEIGYQHAVAMARTVEHVGAAAVRKAEAVLLQSAEAMDPGQFVTVVKSFEHRVDAEAALREANHAHQRRYLSISEPINGLAKIEGQLVADAAATIRSAIEPYLRPMKDEDRSGGQRMHDALVEACRRSGKGHAEGAGPRPHLIIKATLDTVAGVPGSPAGELDWGGTVPAETVRRMACDAAITRITGLGELEHEITHASRSIPPATRRAMVLRDGHCVFPGCDRPPAWCDGHHLWHWADGGPTKLHNLCLVCEAHHRRIHEEGWRLERKDERRWVATPPAARVDARSRSS